VTEVSARLHPEAEADAEAARAWYAKRNKRAADAFLAELDRAMLHICEAPPRWPAVYGRYRRFLLHKYPFSVIYLEDANGVAVIAVAHHRRRPGFWRQRVPRAL
jgi:plasmid stabilization system protein ParE